MSRYLENPVRKIASLITAAVLPLTFAHAKPTQKDAAAANQSAATEDTSSDRFMNVRLQQAGVFSVYTGAGVDFKIADHFALGPEFKVFSQPITIYGDPEYQEDYAGYQGGVRLTWYRRGTFKRGLYAAAELGYASSSTTVHFYDGTSPSASTSGVIFSAMAGYAFFWSHFNLMLGAGWATGSLTSTTLTDSSGQEHQDTATIGLGPVFDLNLGWTF